MMNYVIHFIQSTIGRLVRIIVGIALIVVGLLFISGTGGYVVAIIGLVPLFVGMAGICLIAPLFGYTLNGEKRSLS
jgi:hypothetical protein